MKFKIERKQLVKALTSANAVVERSNTIPVLANVMLNAVGHELQITATDLDIQIRQTVPAEVNGIGTTTVNASMLLDVVRKMADGALIECEMVDNQLVVKSGRARLKLLCLPAEDFPTFGLEKPQAEFKIEASDLGTLIRRAGFAVSTDESRYYLNGVFLHWRAADNTLACVGTDGHRLSLAWEKAPDGAMAMPGIIVPKKTAQLVVKNADGSGEVLVRVSESKISLQWGDTFLASKLIDGTFPDYDRVIPKANQNVFTGPAKAITAAVDRVVTVSAEKGRSCKFSFSEGSLAVSMTDPAGGMAEDTLDGSYDGVPLDIGFNARYVMDVISHLDAEEVIWELGDAGSPSILKSVDPEARHFAVVMPMRV